MINGSVGNNNNGSGVHPSPEMNRVCQRTSVQTLATPKIIYLKS